MSDPIAVSILAKLTSWYDFESDLTDAHGSNDIGTGVSVSGYVAGKQGLALNTGSIGAVTLAAPIAFSLSSGQITVGGWFYYSAGLPARADGGLSYDYAEKNEAMTIRSNTSNGGMGALGWESRGGAGTTYSVYDDGRYISYPITVRVEDQIAQSATSDQIIRVLQPGAPAGWYFTIAEWDSGVLEVFVDTQSVGTNVASAVGASSITKLQLGNQYNGTTTLAIIDSLFLCDGDLLTAAEKLFLFNDGAGVDYADIVAAAA